MLCVLPTLLCALVACVFKILLNVVSSLLALLVNSVVMMVLVEHQLLVVLLSLLVVQASNVAKMVSAE